MLVLTRKSQEKIQVGDSITVTILRVKGQAVRLGIEAPEGVRILRGELADRLSQDGVVEFDVELEEPTPKPARRSLPPTVGASLLQFRVPANQLQPS